ncbi:MAG: iron-containing alcohol dehydrogenase [Sediminimonas sp.]|uniref:iron-containing alcohol dehydrogenase n=1 Tax=Sediminimonas sp. TaxID=2823379 RepID=UPI00286FC6FF|nr:iron-containing alcohol dehydrogenase [Sediminimonas sp.]MDR9486135.1 iron-containing alcohol dehydrogenase [Sediminimonas sp.]
MPHDAFSFLTAGEIRFGRGGAADAAARVATLGRRVLLVHGARAARADWLNSALRDAGCTVTALACPREPDLALIEAGVALGRDAGAEVVVALGGGAALDTGKAVAALIPADRPIMDHLEVVGQGLPLDHAPLPFVALPTTAGTGAEVTRNAVIDVPQARRKVSLRDPRMLPDLALVDPALTDDLPAAQTLASGLDAVTQVIEPYLSRRANLMTDALCRDAIPRGLRALCSVMADGTDAQARDDMAWISLCGGLALSNAGLGAVHGLAGPVGGMSHAPHGAVCGALLPGVLSANAGAAVPGSVLDARLQEVRGWIAAALGCDAGDAFAALARWSSAQGLPRLGAMDVARADLPAIAAAAVGSSSMRANPVELTAETLQEILEHAM